MHLLCHGFRRLPHRQVLREFFVLCRSGITSARNWCVFAPSSLQNRANTGQSWLVGPAIGHYSARHFSFSATPMEPRSIPDFIEDLAKRLSASLPPNLANLKTDVENNFRSVLQSGLTKLDLVTRQEFDVQAGVLKRTREKLETLEARLAELQSHFDKK